jgi:threonine aldolase
MNRIIDLRSDTLTHPTIQMREAMFNATVGDDAYGEDLSVKKLESYCATLFKKEAALFMPSGTMSNQVAIRAHTNPGEEVITHSAYHINFFESSQTSSLCGVTLNLCDSPNGLLTPVMLKAAYASKARGKFYAKPTLLFLENTVSSTSGTFYTPSMIQQLRAESSLLGLSLHIDGARIFNACVASNSTPERYSTFCDSLSISFSKGLGAPFGSMLLGNVDFIENCRLYRKWFGGALHQAGYMAAAALTALQEPWDKILFNDHKNTNILATSLRTILPANHVQHGGTNIVIVSLDSSPHEAGPVVEILKQEGILCFPWTKKLLRFVVHKNLSEQDLALASHKIQAVFLSLGIGAGIQKNNNSNVIYLTGVH